MNTFQDYMVQLVTKKPKEQRWGQWAMNLAYEMSDKNRLDKIDLVKKGGDADCWEINEMNHPKFVNFLKFIME